MFVGDVLSVPFRSESVDVAISIAVIHHLSTDAHRLRALEELVRIIKPGGQVLVYAWAQVLVYLERVLRQQEQEENSRRKFVAQDVFVPWTLPKNFQEPQPGEDSSQIPPTTTFQRYCHVYQEGEIDKLFARIPGVIIEESYYDHSNWCVRARKQVGSSLQQ